MQDRGNWTSKFGFIMAAAGSAIGLGNIWKFPYVAGKNGGAGFLLIYLAIILTIGFSVLMAELVIGRSTQRNPVGAFKALKQSKFWPLVGYMGIISAFMILSFYIVVAGWTLAYIGKSMSGLLSADQDAIGAMFGGFISSPFEPVAWAAAFMAMVVYVVIGGVSEGLEKASRYLMPALFVLVVIMCVRSMTLDGAMAGWEFFTTPKWEDVTYKTVIEALGQAFFSLSLGVGTIITYGSYIDRKTDIVSAGVSVVILDTVIAVMAGIMILPAVFAFNLDPGAGPGLTFVTLPYVFSQMPGGAFFAPMFFLLLAIAALTSAVSLLEVVTAYFVDEKGMSRKKVTIFAGVVGFILCIPSSLSLGVWSDYTIFGKGFLDCMDFMVTNITMPLAGMLFALFVGWVVPEKMILEFTGGNPKYEALAKVWQIFARYISPLAILIVMLNGLPVISNYMPWN